MFYTCFKRKEDFIFAPIRDLYQEIPDRALPRQLRHPLRRARAQ